MRFRPKSVRRISTLAVLCGGIGLGGWGLYKHNQQVNRDQLIKAGKDGLTAYRAGDYTTALTKLGAYLRQYNDFDRDAGFAWAISRSRIETPSGSNLGDAINKLEELLERRPGDLEAQHALLDLYRRARVVDAQVKLADRVLAKHKDDTAALRSRVYGLIAQNALADALAANRRYCELVPLDLEAQLLSLTLMKSLGQTDGQMIVAAREQFDAHPGDPRFELLLATAYQSAGDDEQGIRFLQMAAAHPIADVTFIRYLTSCFDQLKQFDTSRELLETTADRSNDLGIQRLLVTRLWQNGRFAALLKHLQSLDINDAKSDAQLLAFRAIALFSTDQLPAAREVVAALARRKKDRLATAWAAALHAHFDEPDRQPLAEITALQKARNDDPDNGVLNAWLAEAYWQIAEHGLALRHWSIAADALPTWPAALIGKSRALLALGRSADALAAAEAAYRMRPDLPAATHLAQVRFRLLNETGSPDQAEGLVKLVDQIQVQSPGEPQTLPIQIALEARAGRRGDAVARLRGVLKRAGQLDDQTLLKLAAVSRENGLGLEADLLAAAAPQQQTPQLVLTRAALLADAGRADEGLSLIDCSAAAAAKAATQASESGSGMVGRAAMSSSSSPPDSVGDSPAVMWQLVRVQFLEATSAPAAAAQWKKIGDDHPDNLQVQQAVLAGSESTRDDEAFINRTIDRLHQLTGDNAQQWQLERAKALLAGGGTGPQRERARREAATTLTNMVRESPRQIEPRLYLARALEQSGQLVSATQHLQSALTIDPQNGAVVLELVRVLMAQGKTDDVRELLKSRSADTTVAGRQRVLLATLLAEAGEPRTAIALLDRGEARRNLEPAGRQLLAELLSRGGQSVKAEAIYDSLLGQPGVTPSAIASAAEFYASNGNRDRAATELQRLRDLPLAAGQYDVAAGRFEERWGSPEAAVAHFRRAAEAHAVAGWTGLIEFYIRRSDFAAASAAAKEGLVALPADKSLVSLKLEAEALSLGQSDPDDLQPLIDVLSADPARAAETETLKALRDLKANPADRAATLTRLRSIADAYPRFFPLQQQLVLAYMSSGATDDATAVAARTMGALPNDARAAELATFAWRAAGRWGNMKTAAEAWRQRSVTSDLIKPDFAIAQARLESSDVAGARRAIDPYLDRLKTAAPTEPALVVTAARILCAAGEVKTAMALMEPLTSDPVGRKMWMQIGASGAFDVASGSAWLDHLGLAIPADAPDEWIDFGLTWSEFAAKFDDNKSFRLAAQLLDSHLSDRPARTDARYRLAQVNSRLQKLPEAEKALREVLSENADHADALNDLAYVLLGRNLQLAEAETFARRATTLAPTNARFFDTLARVQLARGNEGAAEQSFKTALRFEPNQTDALLGLARLLAARGDRSEAARLLDRLDAVLALNPADGKRLNVEVTDLREGLSRNGG